VIYLTEVAPNERAGKGFLDHLPNANNDANPELMRVALKLATALQKRRSWPLLIAWQTVNSRAAAEQAVHPRLSCGHAGHHYQGSPARPAAQRPRQLLREP
jgi:hypothetical protein